ncbi:MAG: ABC transporter permease [Faecousia sp.]
MVRSFINQKILFLKSLIPFAKNDFRRRYAGTNLGIAWAYIQILSMVLVYWFVFQFGLKTSMVQNVPFLPWFISGYMPWMLFSECIMTCMGCMMEYNYIVKKVLFNINIIPAAKIAVSSFIHSFFLITVIIIAILHGFYPGVYFLQLFYYVIALYALVIPLGYLVCTISVFFKDFGQIVTIILNIMMWATPILWDYHALEGKMIVYILKIINPMFYVVCGFRESILFRVGLLEHLKQGIWFWFTVLVLWKVCFRVYRRLVPQIADVM